MTSRWIAWVSGLLGIGLSAAAFFHYRRDLRAARNRISAGSRIADTPCGPIEYSVAGEGPPLLVVHGAGGGFDQSMEIAAPLVQNGFRIIAMSRFGYLRTPLPVDASPMKQADAHAHLLDALGIQRVAVIGASAGAPSCMQFALRYPQRTTALVLLVPLAHPYSIQRRSAGALPARISAATNVLFDTALQSDFFFWLARRFARKAMLQGILGTPFAVLEKANAEERLRVTQLLDHIQPLSLRRPGLLNDAAVVRSLVRYHLEQISVPTLIFALADCLYGTYEGARYSAENIPGAHLISYPSGGHLWVEHHKEIIDEIVKFLKSPALIWTICEKPGPPKFLS